MLTDVQRGQHTYFQWPALRTRTGLGHAFSSRTQNVREESARQTFCADFGFTHDELTWQNQVHQPRISVVTDETPSGRLPETDATIVTAPRRPVLAFSADCPLVLLHDHRQNVLAVAHASWRCMVAELVALVVRQMVADFDCRPEDIAAGIGPSAGPERYEVGRDVFEAAAHLPDRDAIFRPHADRWLLDLWTGNRGQLLREGVAPGAIEVAQRCTISEPEMFFSYRREGVGCGHFGLMAWLEARKTARNAIP